MSSANTPGKPGPKPSGGIKKTFMSTERHEQLVDRCAERLHIANRSLVIRQAIERLAAELGVAEPPGAPPGSAGKNTG
jgi:hypothetical protein